MKLLCFQARHFSWKSFSKTLDEIGGEKGDDVTSQDEMRDCVVVFAHAEIADESPESRSRVFRHTLKHIKWLANKRDLKHVVLHSFAHLGGQNAEPAFAKAILSELAERLIGSGYAVKSTPFGYFCEWQIDVHGESMAKVFKQI